MYFGAATAPRLRRCSPRDAPLHMYNVWRPTVNIYDMISLLGAIATFLFGMTTMTSSLEKLSSGRLESILERLTNNLFMSVLIGALVTGLVHSSAATTIMCVGFVNSGIMKLEQTVGIIMGANIGTTVTAQILRLGDVSSDNLFLSMMRPEYFGPIMAVAGIVLYMFVKGGKKRIVGQLLLGLGLLFISMHTMTASVAPLQDVPEFRNLFVAFSNPLLGILVGALVTALLQSSTASVGILQALTSTGVITFNIAFPIIMGQNIGTCITTLISSIGASRNAKRTAMLHLYFNVIGTLIFLAAIYGAQLVAAPAGGLPFWSSVMNMGDIASFHTFFNIGCTVLLLPFHKQLVRLVERTVPGDESHTFTMLDERFLATPAVALERAHDAVVHMGSLARDNYHISVALLSQYDAKKAETLQENEDTLDKLEGALDNYLVRLSDHSLSAAESAQVSELLHTLSDFERMGDYSVNISESAAILHDRNISFTDAARRELSALTDAVGEALDKTLDCYTNRSRALAFQVEPLEEVVDLLRDELKNRHIERFKTGACTIEQGTQFLELLINLERVSDHCSNVALQVLRRTAPKNDLVLTDTHAYLHQLHHGSSQSFDDLFASYRKKYMAPIGAD